MLENSNSPGFRNGIALESFFRNHHQCREGLGGQVLNTHFLGVKRKEAIRSSVNISNILNLVCSETMFFIIGSGILRLDLRITAVPP